MDQEHQELKNDGKRLLIGLDQDMTVVPVEFSKFNKKVLLRTTVQMLPFRLKGVETVLKILLKR